jgi:hypothetical protein
VRAKEDAIAVKTYTGEQIAEGSKQGLWAQQNRQSGAIPPNLPSTSSETAGGSLTNVSFPQVRPARHLTRFQHSAFSIAYPENWQVSGDQQSAVTIAPQAGVGAGAIAYGVVIGGAQTRTQARSTRLRLTWFKLYKGPIPGCDYQGARRTSTLTGSRVDQ